MRKRIVLYYEGSVSITVEAPLYKSKKATAKFLQVIKDTEKVEIKGYSYAHAIGYDKPD